MTSEELLQRFLEAYRVYFNVEEAALGEPWAARAVFSSVQEQYFLLKSAKIAGVESNEYVYFALRDRGDPEEVEELCRLAWEEGIARVHPGPEHKSSDVTLILITGEDPGEELRRAVRRIRYSKTYKMLRGFSTFRVAVIGSPSGEAVYNSQGKLLKGLVTDIVRKRDKGGKKE